MKSPYDINAHFIGATHRAVYNCPTEEHPYHTIYIVDDKDEPLNALRFDETLDLFDTLKDKERIIVTMSPPKPDGSIDFDIQQLS